MPTKTKGGSGGYDPKNIKRNRNKRKVKASEEKEKRNDKILSKQQLKEQKHRPKSDKESEEKRNTTRQERALLKKEQINIEYNSDGIPGNIHREQLKSDKTDERNKLKDTKNNNKPKLHNYALRIR